MALSLPIPTEHLVLRRFCDDDRAAFLAYRRHPDVARYQSWDVDYSDAAADSFLAEMTTAPVWRPGEWFQIAVEHEGALVGDVALWPDPDGAEVEIGYSLHPDHQTTSDRRDCSSASASRAPVWRTASGSTGWRSPAPRRAGRSAAPRSRRAR